jgi:GH24 family phage-related lysozyme (muramidase)
MPDLVRAICVDLVFNAGVNKFAKYKNFIKAIKAEDYRRASLELLDSKDYNNNIVEKNGEKDRNGLAKRRLDAAIELSKLAEELQ